MAHVAHPIAASCYPAVTQAVVGVLLVAVIAGFITVMLAVKSVPTPSQASVLSWPPISRRHHLAVVTVVALFITVDNTVATRLVSHAPPLDRLTGAGQAQRGNIDEAQRAKPASERLRLIVRSPQG